MPKHTKHGPCIASKQGTHTFKKVCININLLEGVTGTTTKEYTRCSILQGEHNSGGKIFPCQD